MRFDLIFFDSRIKLFGDVGRVGGSSKCAPATKMATKNAPYKRGALNDASFQPRPKNKTKTVQVSDTRTSKSFSALLLVGH